MSNFDPFAPDADFDEVEDELSLDSDEWIAKMLA
jgi:hypothetical protein